MSHNQEERSREEQKDLDALDHGADTPPPRRRRTDDEVPIQQEDWKGRAGYDAADDDELEGGV